LLWNIERYDQEANYGDRVVGTTLRHSDYAAMARAASVSKNPRTSPARFGARSSLVSRFEAN
jgi:acetolactate synthase-1/2/3 large subunit